MAENFPFSYAAGEIPDVSRLTGRQQYPDPTGQVDSWARRLVAGEGPIATLTVLSGGYDAGGARGIHLPGA